VIYLDCEDYQKIILTIFQEVNIIEDWIKEEHDEAWFHVLKCTNGNGCQRLKLQAKRVELEIGDPKFVKRPELK
jgi:hypothetical protein